MVGSLQQHVPHLRHAVGRGGGEGDGGGVERRERDDLCVPAVELGYGVGIEVAAVQAALAGLLSPGVDVVGGGQDRLRP